MSFVPLNNFFKQWLIKKGFQEQEYENGLKEVLAQYCVTVKQWPSDWVTLRNYTKNNLVIICKNSNISSQLKIEEDELKNYLIKHSNNSNIKINRISFQVK